MPRRHSVSSASPAPSFSSMASPESPPASAASASLPPASSSSTSSSENAASLTPAASAETKGWLYKWTNYLKGYQKRWFVLSNDLLSYYRNQSEMAHTCRGTISLNNAVITTEDSSSFIVSNGGGTLTYHLRASGEVERQRWITALELAKARALRMMESGEDLDEMTDPEDDELQTEITKQDLTKAVKAMKSSLHDLSTCSNLIGKHTLALQTALNEMCIERVLELAPAPEKAQLKEKIKTVNERAALLKITAGAMVNASNDYVQQCQSDGRHWQRLLNHERENRQRLEDMVEQLAKQHSQLETMVRKEYEAPATSTIDGACNFADPTSAHHMSAIGGVASQVGIAASVTSNSGSDEDDTFVDAVEDHEVLFEVNAPPSYNVFEQSTSRSESDSKDEEDLSDEEEAVHDPETIQVYQKKSILDEVDADQNAGETKDSSPSSSSQLVRRRQRRTCVPDRPNISISLWGIVKNCIGKDLTKIPVPVNFSEPLSMLQRLTEDYEYSEILDKAASCQDKYEQMAYVAAFTVSSYSTTAIRSNKPFNPLLGETYELDRSDDLGFRCISEQVSHHPPMVAQFGESSKGLWRCWQEFSMRSKFKGKYLEVEPLGIAHLVFPQSGNHYTWRKVKTVVHNIVIGKLWVDQHGEMVLNNHTTGDKCHMKFEPYSYFGGTSKKVTGTILNQDEKVEWVLNGTWDKKMEGSKVIAESTVKGKSTLEIGPSRLLWSVRPIAAGADKYYHFSQFACELNELEDGLAPTDSRLRPDQRLMEDGDWDDANREKVRLEDKQRAVRRQREEEAALAAKEGRAYEGYVPTWFKRTPDEQYGDKLVFTYSGGYWEAKERHEWTNCPDIF